MKKPGAHVSIAGGLFNAPDHAKEIGASAFAMFSKNQRQWFAPEPDDNAVNWFRFHLASAKIKPEDVLVHSSYLINLGNADKEKFAKSFDSFLGEARILERLGLTLLNFHPGSHVNLSSPHEAMKQIADAVNRAVSETDKTVFVLETMAGQGTSLGSSFEELSEILSHIKNPARVGVCIDTCHIFSAGYDLRTEESYTKTMYEFERLIGFSYLKGVHLNDSKNPLGSRVDRHESLGDGALGWLPFELIMNDDRFEEIPLILETPRPERWADEIRILKEKCKFSK
ncbi:MAG: deoxyribonuclease IV [Spirochaetia bacterium]|nr:deoxyribonuclease IV [Spirochaetia bacterium]